MEEKKSILKNSKEEIPKNAFRPSSHGQGQPYEVHHHYYYEPPRSKAGRSSKPGIAGALLIITAVLGLIVSAFIVGGSMFIGDMNEGFEFWGMGDKGDVTGEVLYLNGSSVENATITIVGEDLSTQTDKDGLYIIYNVPSGNQKIKVEKEGYNTIIYKAFISPSEAKWKANVDDNSHQNWDSDNEYDFIISPGTRTLDRGSYPPFGMIGSIMVVCAALIIIFSIIALIGGFFALKRKNFKYAIIGAVFGIFTGIGALLSLISLFILILSRDEFNKDTKEGKY